jgi:HTH-type transcriptional regulator/antitoxin HipB
MNKYAKAYIDLICGYAYIISMTTIIRTSKQLGSALRRIRKGQGLTQQALGDKMHARQATISKLEAGEPATQLRTFLDALAALNLELVVRHRTAAPEHEIEDLF